MQLLIKPTHALHDARVAAWHGSSTDDDMLEKETTSRAPRKHHRYASTSSATALLAPAGMARSMDQSSASGTPHAAMHTLTQPRIGETAAPHFSPSVSNRPLLPQSTGEACMTCVEMQLGMHVDLGVSC